MCLKREPLELEKIKRRAIKMPKGMEEMLLEGNLRS